MTSLQRESSVPTLTGGRQNHHHGSEQVKIDTYDTLQCNVKRPWCVARVQVYGSTVRLHLDAGLGQTVSDVLTWSGCFYIHRKRQMRMKQQMKLQQ